MIPAISPGMAPTLAFTCRSIFQAKSTSVAFRQSKRRAVQELRPDVMEQRAVNPILEGRRITRFNRQRLGHFKQARLHGVADRFIGYLRTGTAGCRSDRARSGSSSNPCPPNS